MTDSFFNTASPPDGKAKTSPILQSPPRSAKAGSSPNKRDVGAASTHDDGAELDGGAWHVLEFAFPERCQLDRIAVIGFAIRAQGTLTAFDVGTSIRSIIEKPQAR